MKLSLKSYSGFFYLVLFQIWKIKIGTQPSQNQPIFLFYLYIVLLFSVYIYWLVFVWFVFILLIIQSRRISVTDALSHPYLDEGRLRYHSCMCKCCKSQGTNPNITARRFTPDFEPVAPVPFQDSWEQDLTSTRQVRGNSRVWLRLSDFLSFFI